MKKKSLIIAIFILFLFSEGYGNSYKWKLIHNKNGVKSYTRKIKGSKIVEIKAITTINAKLEVVATTLRDINAYPTWQANCKKASIIKKFDNNNMTIYYLLDFPIPVSDRDIIVKANTDYNTKTARGTVKLREINNSPLHRVKGVIRMKSFSGTYILEYLARNKTGIVYSYRADPGGRIPSFIVNLFSQNVLYKTLLNLKKAVKKKKYIKIAENSDDKKIFEKIIKNKTEVKGILKRRLLEQFKNRNFAKLMSGNPKIINLFISGNGEILEMIFLSWGAISAKKKAVKKLLKIYLQDISTDNKKIDKILNNKELIKTIIFKKANPKISLKKMIYQLLK